MTTQIAKPAKYPRGQHPNSRANLKPPYKPGENGHGRVYPLKERLRHALDHPLKKPKDDAPAGEHIVYATLKGALNCEPTFAHLREVWDRVEGKLQDQTVAIDNRQIHIHVDSPEGRGLVEGIAERTKMLRGSGGNSDPG